MPIRFAVTLLLIAVLAMSVSADGCYVPKIDPRSRARDITEPTQKAAIAYFNGQERMILQVSYKGDVSEFCWLVPTPSRPKVSRCELDDGMGETIFERLHEATAPRWRYWFDADRPTLLLGTRAGGASSGRVQPLQVDVVERTRVGVYDVAVLRARNANDLVIWLTANGYRVAPRLTSVMSDYISRGWVFTAARIDASKMRQSAQRLRGGTLEPLQFAFKTPQPVYPLKISSMNPGRTKILLYAAAEHRGYAPSLQTTCVLKYPSREAFRIRGAAKYWLLGDGGRQVFLTKMDGDLAASEMNSDLLIKPAPSDEIIIPSRISPPFLENLGALVISVIAFPVVPPLLMLGIVVGTVLSFAGRPRGTAWFCVAFASMLLWICFLVVSVSLSQFGNWPVGLLSRVLSAVGALLLGRRLLRKTRPCQGE